ncbi:MAG: VOC family protein [Thiohalomonadales bacterium]
MLTNPILFIATANPDRCRHFFQTQLGFRLNSEDDFALVFNLGTTQLRIQKVEAVTSAPYTVLGWSVDNIEDCVAALCTKGVEFDHYEALAQDELAIWQSPSGAKIAWFKDPDGNTLSLTEFT